MLKLLQALTLGILQGFTEFLPVSSSGHLAVLLNITNWNEEKILPFIIFVHAATTLTVIIYFRKSILLMMKSLFAPSTEHDPAGRKLLGFILVGSIPTAAIALTLNDFFEKLFSSPRSVAVGLIFTGTILLAAEKVAARTHRKADLSCIKAVLIGAAQGAGIAPGVSRSGITIGAGLLLGISRQEAFSFSFLLSIPANIGALALEIKNLGLLSFDDILAMAVAMAAAFVTGYWALALLSRMVREGKLFIFAYYCCLLAVIIVLTIR